MKTFELKKSEEAGLGEVTQQILEFLTYDGDSKLHTNGLVDGEFVQKKIQEHNLSGFIQTRGFSKVVAR